MFVLGNNDALPCCVTNLTNIPMRAQLANPKVPYRRPAELFGRAASTLCGSVPFVPESGEDEGDLPLFSCRRPHGHQEKINTQLAGWSQLRHDNLLYAKQSYTGERLFLSCLLCGTLSPLFTAG
jgi:hypothetical protein